MGDTGRPKVFISYSWDSEEHKSWVRNLAEALMENGVFTYLDQWHLKLGRDRIAFMNKILECDKVLMICTPQYVIKANSMKNGVGEEQGIIIGKRDFKKYEENILPILRDGNEKPAYFGTKIHLDLRKDEEFEAKFEELLRNILDEPRYTPPPLGSIPSFLQNSDKNSLIKLQQSIDGILKQSDYRRKVSSLGEDYTLELVIGNNKNTDFFPQSDESEWLISCSPTTITRSDIRSYPENFIAEVLNYQLRITGGQIYFLERFDGDKKTVNLPILIQTVLDWMLYYHKICQYRQFQGIVGIKIIIDNLRGFNLQISPHQDFYLRIPNDSLILPEHKNEIDLFKSYESELDHFVISSTDEIFSIMKEITQYIIHSFGYSRFGFIESYIGRLLLTTDSFRIKSHKYEKFILKGFQFSDDIPKVSSLI